MVQISSAKKDLGFSERRENINHLKQSQLGKHRLRAALGLVFIAACLACAFILFNNQQNVISIFESAGSLGFVGFVVVISIAIMLLLPTPILKMIAGAVLPLHIAVLVNFIGSMIGGFGAFIFGRWLFRDGLVEAISKKPKLERIHSAIGEESLRISVLIRLSPVIPDEWLNYILAAGPVNTKTFTISNCASIVYCFAYAYYGWVFGQIALKEEGFAAFSESTGALVMLVCGLIATVVATIVVTRVTMRALNDVMEDGGAI
tara:strand:- start:182 stop:964 length:783 start_codon:yes stop_codon:yes gene_type:complete